jgi:hypothetical protein
LAGLLAAIFVAGGLRKIENQAPRKSDFQHYRTLQLRQRLTYADGCPGRNFFVFFVASVGFEDGGPSVRLLNFRLDLHEMDVPLDLRPKLVHTFKTDLTRNLGFNVIIVLIQLAVL